MRALRPLLWLTLVAGVLSSAGCSLFDPASYGLYCPDGAIGVDFELLSTKNTDEIDIIVWVDGKTKFTQKLTRQPGGTSETLKVDVPDYGKYEFENFNIVAVAKLRGKVVGGGRTSKQIDTKCTTVNVDISTSSLSSYCTTDSDCTSAGDGGVVTGACSNYCCPGSFSCT